MAAGTQHKIDSEVAASLAAIAARAGEVPVSRRGDWHALRASGAAGLSHTAGLWYDQRNV